MNVLITGASGFVGRAFYPLLLEKGYKVYGLFRKPPKWHIPPPKWYKFIPLIGDITKPDLGLEEIPEDIHAVYHIAGIHNLGEDKDGSIWRTNVLGTENVLNLCLKYGVPRLFFTSTAYTWECNTYGRSKIKNEEDIKEYSAKYGLKATIFKPSIIMGTAEHPYPGHFMQFVSGVVKIHQRAELIRRKIEGTLRLPVIEPVFRIKGNPDGKLNLIPVDQVVWGMANIEEPGTYWLTHSNPPTLGQLVQWVGESIMVDFRIMPDFKTTPIEAMFANAAKSFQPYLWGDSFKSDLDKCPEIDRAFIQETIKRSLLAV